MKYFQIAVTCLALTFGASLAQAEEHVVEMLNRGADGVMVFEPGVVIAQPGDTIHFKATTLGHHVRSYAVPEGAEDWYSPMSEDYRVTVTQEGLYLYACPPHIVMAMVGIVQVGAPTNQAEFDTAVEALEARFGPNKDRLATYIERLNTE